MAVTIVSFRWLEILEKEFDKNFVDLDLLIGDLDGEEPDFVYAARQKLAGLSSCFAQLTHKAQTIFQNSAKIEAELVDLRAELVNSKTRQEILEEESRNLVLQLHSLQLDRLPSNQNPEQYKEKIETALKLSPSKSTYSEEITFRNSSEIKKLKNELLQYQSENIILRNSILALHSEVYGARLAAKYLDKELAGRIQQLQLLGKEMRTDIRDKLWRQLESEILLHRHKTVIRACRNRTNHEFIQSDSRILNFNQSEQRFLKNEFNLHQSDPLIKFDVNSFCRSGDGIFFNKSEPRYMGQQSDDGLYHNRSDSLNNQSSEFMNERNNLDSNDLKSSKEKSKNVTDVENSVSSLDELSIDNINNNAKEKDIFLIGTDPSDLEKKEVGKEEEKTDEEKMEKDELKIKADEDEKKIRNSEGEDEFSCMIGEKRTVIVKRQPGQGLGISITGGREHGVPILISELEVGGPAYECKNLYVGDAILKVNNVSLENASHFEAVKILTNLETSDVKLLVQFIAVDTDEENSLSEDLYGYRYRFFDTEVMDSSDALGLHPLHANSAHTPTAPRTPDYCRNERSYSNYIQSPKQSFDGYYSSPSHSDEVFRSQELKNDLTVVPIEENKQSEKLIDVESPKPGEPSERLKIDLFGFRFQTDINDVINYENDDLLDDFLIKNSDSIQTDVDLMEMKEAEPKPQPPKIEPKLEYIDENIFSGLEDTSLLDNIVKSFSEDDFSYLDNDKDKNVTSDSGLEIYLSGSDIDIDKRYFEKRYKEKNYLNESMENSPEKIELKTLQQIFDRSFSSNLSSPRGSTSFDDDILSTEHSDEKSGNSANDFRNKMKDMKNTYNPKKIQKFYPKNMDMSDDILKKTFKNDPLTVILKNDAINNSKKCKRNSSDSIKRTKSGRKAKENNKKEIKVEKMNKNAKEIDCEPLKTPNVYKKKDAINYKITDRFEENLIEYNVKQYDVEDPIKKEDLIENFEIENKPEKKEEPADEIEETRKLSRKYGLKIPGKVVKSDLNNRLIVAEVKSPDKCIKVIDGHFKHFKPILDANSTEKETKMKAFRNNRFDSFGDPDFGTPV